MVPTAVSYSHALKLVLQQNSHKSGLLSLAPVRFKLVELAGRVGVAEKIGSRRNAPKFVDCDNRNASLCRIVWCWFFHPITPGIFLSETTRKVQCE